ncbi:MAG: Coenzyme F420 hydrogenase/dehydrogenase, beta subunit C-terminal domain, partial [Victivallaceae bacterium]
LIVGLQLGVFDGAIVCNTFLENNKVRTHFVLATTTEAVLLARGSKYVETNFLNEVLPLIRKFNGRVAVVGLPCDISALVSHARKDAVLRERIVMTVALLCGHNSRKELIDHVTVQLERKAGAGLVGYKFRTGHWRGKIEARFADGSIRNYSAGIFNNYQNLFFFCEKKCLACYDHYGYNADISIGDIWLFRLKQNYIKKSGVIVRSDAGQTLFEQAVQAGYIVKEPLDICDIMDGQSRIGPSHYNVSARAKAGKMFGLNLKDAVGEKVKWHQWLNACLTIMNVKLSESVIGKKVIFCTPRPLIKLYLYIKKGLESI